MRRDRDDALKLYYSHVQAHPVLTAEAEIARQLPLRPALH